jgi:hypothetical protein
MATELIGKTEVHEAASLFPLMKGREFKDLVEDIRVNGILTPLLYRNGTLVDGRNRLRAAQELEMDDKDIPKKNLPAMDDIDIHEVVFSMNVTRRHLTEQQRGAIKVAIMEKTGELKKLEEEAQDLRKTSRSETMKAITKVKGTGVKLQRKSAKNQGSHVAKKVAEKAGISVSTAVKVLQTKKHNPTRFAKLSNPSSDSKEVDGRGRGEKKMFRAPNNPKELAKFLLEKWDLADLTDLRDYLQRGLDKLAA